MNEALVWGFQLLYPEELDPAWGGEEVEFDDLLARPDDEEGA